MIELNTWKSGRGVKAILALEAIGDNLSYDCAMMRKLLKVAIPESVDLFKSPWQRPWVAEILGWHAKWKYDRRFLTYDKDFSEANSKGSRGVRHFYLLESGRVYEVHEMITWKRRRRYFCQVTAEGDIQEISEEEVEQWLEQIKNAGSASPSTKLLNNA